MSPRRAKPLYDRWRDAGGVHVPDGCRVEQVEVDAPHGALRSTCSINGARSSAGHGARGCLCVSKVNTSESAFGRIWCVSSRGTAMADSPELAAAKRLLDLAKNRGFRFWRTAHGADGPVWGEGESREWLDTIFLAGFSESCNAARIR